MADTASGRTATSTFASLRRRVAGPMTVRFAFLLVAFIGMSVFMIYLESVTRKQARQQVADYALLMEKSLWQMDHDSATEFIELIVSRDAFHSIRVFHNDGELFARGIDLEPASRVETLMRSLGLVRNAWMSAYVVHNGQRIGYVEAMWVNRNVFVYMGLALLLLLAYGALMVLHAVIDLSGQRRRSEWRVKRERDARRRAQAEASHNREILESVVSGASLILFAVDRQGRFTLCRGRGVALLGQDVNGLMGQPLERLFCEQSAARTLLERAIDGEVVRATLPVSDKSFDCWLSPYRLRSNDVVGAIGVCTDITAVKAAERQLIHAKEEAEAANKAKSVFLAKISHELRTPLNSIIGFAMVLVRDEDGRFTEDQLHYITRIGDNGRHLLGIINQILDLSKVEAGRVDIQIGPVDLRELAEDVVHNFQTQAEKRENTLLTRLPEELQVLQTDATKLRQILINLISNAIKFTKRGAVTLAIEADDDGRPVRIQVSDTGVGIPGDKLHELFDAFHQVDNQTSRHYEGTGLGLTISRALCELLGYELHVDSEAGKGTTFTVELQHARVPEMVH